MAEAVLSLGSNLGKRAQNISNALRDIAERIGPIVNLSSIYETDAWGEEDQARFLNLVLTVQTDLPPHGLWEEISQIEVDHGRNRSSRWRERTIDIDILFYDNLVLEDSVLCIPHPRVTDRNFVLVPLLEICPDRIHPVLGQSIRHLYFLCQDRLKVYLTSL